MKLIKFCPSFKWYINLDIEEFLHIAGYFLFLIQMVKYLCVNSWCRADSMKVP